MSGPLFPPPKGFRPVTASRLQWAELRWEGPFGPSTFEPRTDAVRAAGRRYERKVHRRLGEVYGATSLGPLYTPGQWIEFRERGQSRNRWAQPDGLLLDLSRGLLTIVEVKLRHMVKAWWWLRHIYQPLLSFIFPSWGIALLEVVRYYDPCVTWPEDVRLVREPDLLRAGQCGCHIWNGTGNPPRAEQPSSLSGVYA